LLSSDGIFEILPSDQIADKEEQLRNVLQQCSNRLEDLVDALGIDSLDAVPDDIALLNISGEAHA
jgi:hypothetical protein